MFKEYVVLKEKWNGILLEFVILYVIEYEIKNGLFLFIIY